MATKLKRIMVTLRPEWEDDLLQLKKEKFFNTTKSAMFQYLIALGLEVEKNSKNQKQNPA